MEAAENMKITARNLKELGIIDNIVDEPDGGAEEDFESVCKTLKNMLLKNIEKLLIMSNEQLLKQRYEKYRKIGGLCNDIKK